MTKKKSMDFMPGLGGRDMNVNVYREVAGQIVDVTNTNNIIDTDFVHFGDYKKVLLELLSIEAELIDLNVFLKKRGSNGS